MYACFHSVGLPDLPILQAIEAVKAAGYAAIEINAETLPWAGPHVTPETDKSERDAIRSACKSLELVIPAIGAHIAMVDPVKSKRRAAIDFVVGCTDLARDVGAPVVHILSGPQAPGTPRAEAWAWFAEAVAETVAYADRLGIALAIEAIAGHLFHQIDDYRQLAADLPGTAIRVNFDPSHMIVQGEDPAGIFERFADRIVNVHLKDGKGRYPDFSFPPLGLGSIDFVQLTGLLAHSGYTGAMSVEYEAQVFGFRETQEHVLSHGRQYLNQLGV